MSERSKEASHTFLMYGPRIVYIQKKNEIDKTNIFSYITIVWLEEFFY